MQRHKIKVTLRGIFGRPIYEISVVAFGTLIQAKEIAREYGAGMSKGLFERVTYEIESFEHD